MFSAELRKPRFSEFDIGGVLHHSNYLKLYEELRELWLVSAGLPYSQLIERGYHIAVAGADQQFLKPIYYDQPLIGEAETIELGKTSFTVRHRLSSPTDPTITLSSAMIRLVLVKRSDDGFKPERLFDDLRTILEG